MVKMIYPERLLNSEDIATDIKIASGYYRRHSMGQRAEPGDFPRVLNCVWPGPLPDAMAYGMFWIVSKKFLSIVQAANGPQWPIEASAITFAAKSIGRFDFMFMEVAPSFNRFNHDEETYPDKKTDSIKEGVRWERSLASSPTHRTMRPRRQGDPSFWKESAVVEGDTLWGGESRSLFVSDDLWEVLDSVFPGQFSASTVTVKDLSPVTCIDADDGAGATSPTTQAAPAGDTPEAGQYTAAQIEDLLKRDRVFRLTLAKVMTILMESPEHGHLRMADLKSLVVPPLLVDQVWILDGVRPGAVLRSPIAFVQWARVSPEVDRRLSQDEARPPRLAEDEWQSGDIMWIIDAAAQPPEILSPFVLEIVDRQPNPSDVRIALALRRAVEEGRETDGSEENPL